MLQQVGRMLYSPTLRRLRLASALRRLRQDASLTVTEVARRLNWPASKVTRLESGEAKRPKPADVDALLDVYEVVDAAQRKTMLALARDARAQGWWRGYGDVFRGVLPDLEAEATAIRTYEALYVPGLLQTPEYAAAIFATDGHDEEAVARRVAARMARQEILAARDHPPTLSVLIDEAALRKRIGGPQVMRAQLLRLVNAARLPHVSIRVVTDQVGAHPGMIGPFVLLTFPSPEDPQMVYLESARTSLCMETSEDVDHYEGIFDRVSAVALPGQDSIGLITDLADRLAAEGGGDHE